LIPAPDELTIVWRLLRSLVSGGVVVLGVGVGVGLGAGVVIGDETGVIAPLEEESFTGAVGAASKGVVTEPRLKLLELDDEVLDGNAAGTTPLLPVRPSQRPWQDCVVDPEPVVPGWRP
jgi:hypothetical protein